MRVGGILFAEMYYDGSCMKIYSYSISNNIVCSLNTSAWTFLAASVGLYKNLGETAYSIRAYIKTSAGESWSSFMDNMYTSIGSILYPGNNVNINNIGYALTGDIR